MVHQRGFPHARIWALEDPGVHATVRGGRISGLHLDPGSRKKPAGRRRRQSCRHRQRQRAIGAEAPKMGLKMAVAPQAEVSSAAVLNIQEWHRRTAAPSEGDAPAQNLSIEDRAVMERRFTIIEPLLFPEKYTEVWRACGGRRLKVAAWIASERGCKARTVRHWETNYKRRGMMGLVKPDRSDKGTFPSLNRAARDLILRLAISKLSTSEQCRVYEEERVWRDEHIGELLHGQDAADYAQYLDEDGRLSEEARLPKISSMTLRRFAKTIPYNRFRMAVRV